MACSVPMRQARCHPRRAARPGAWPRGVRPVSDAAPRNARQPARTNRDAGCRHEPRGTGNHRHLKRERRGVHQETPREALRPDGPRGSALEASRRRVPDRLR